MEVDQLNPTKQQEMKRSQDPVEANSQADEELRKASDELREATMNLACWVIGKGIIARKSDPKLMARERIRQCRDNRCRENRGTSIFVISRATFAKIIRAIRNSNGYSRQETARVLLKMYLHGYSFDQTQPKISRKTAHRYLVSAIQDLGVFTGYGMEASLSTLRTSHNLMRDAELLGRDLSHDFLIV